MEDRTYIAIDLKSFYASAECVALGLNPLDTNLVVADKERSEKTICLAVTPSLKAYGIPGRTRLFEVNQRVREINAKRIKLAPRHRFIGKSSSDLELKNHPELALDFIIATPRMAHYIKVSSEIYKIYLSYVAPEDIHIYSIDEVFIDVTEYLRLYKLSAREFTSKLINEVFKATGITATAGIGTNLYLAKVAMDIVAKHIPPDENGVRIAQLDEMGYRQQLWTHRPISDFWRVGHGYAKRLEAIGIYTMGDIALCSENGEDKYLNEELLYKIFGINAELLIDHAWGYEPCTIKDIKAYKPKNNSIGSGQVLPCPYTYEKARVAIKEMADSIALELFEKKLVTNQINIVVGYDIENVKKDFAGEIKLDYYGRKIPKHSNGNINLEEYTSSSKLITNATAELFDKIINKQMLIRRLYITANRVINEVDIPANSYRQLDLFTDYKLEEEEFKKAEIYKKREKSIQETLIAIKKKYGKNSILKGLNFEDGATAKERNGQIGGHKA